MDESPWRARMHPPPDITYQQSDPGFMQQGLPIDGALISAWLEGLKGAERVGGGAEGGEAAAAFDRAVRRMPATGRMLLEKLRRIGLTRISQLPLQ